MIELTINFETLATLTQYTYTNGQTAYHRILSYHIISYHIIDLKQQNRLKVGTDKPKLKVKMQSVSGDDVLKDFLKSHILSCRRKVYSDREDVASSGRALQAFGPATGKAWLLTVDCLTGGTRVAMKQAN